ncbi:hypothetical protein [Neorhodopirellula lusitana]|uniref:hypothetical protein n=1 Tax=Neorhodopirellula lusitana TaxID=445327 RepID=UPI00384FE7F0
MIDPSGRFLLACYFQTGQVLVHRIVGEGRLSSEPVELLSIEPHTTVVSPNVLWCWSELSASDPSESLDGATDSL